MPPRVPQPDWLGRILPTLHSFKEQGPGSYPTTVRDLAEKAGVPQAGDLAQLLNKKPWNAAVVVARGKDVESPVALAGDEGLLASSDFMLEYVVRQACSPARPTETVEKIARGTGLARKLIPLFSQAVQDRVVQGHLPASIGILEGRQKKKLVRRFHWKEYPLPEPEPPPLPPHQVLAEDLVKVLHSFRSLGGDSYPAELVRVLKSARPEGVSATLLNKALKETGFTGRALVLFGKKCSLPQNWLVLKEDRDAALGLPSLFFKILRLVRTEEDQLFTTDQLQKHLSPEIQKDWGRLQAENLKVNRLPPGVGCLRKVQGRKKEILVFLMEDVGGGKPAAFASVGQSPSARHDFGQLFEEAFRRVEQHRQKAKFISLVDLRRELPMDRKQFDLGLEELQRAGKFFLSTAEGRDGISAEEREAGIPHEETLLLYVTRRQP